MAEHIEGIVEHSGVDKEVDSGAIAMMMDNVQISQYSYPVKSTIRELYSNGVDSINEKLVAISILKGESKVEDHYYVPGTNPELDEAIKLNPGVYKDSKFDPLYYDLNHLSPINDVEIKYYDRGNTSRDLLVIKDHGVGLGDYRLHGYLKLGYSTKRLAVKPLGKYGIGAKSPLSMGVPYFKVTSVHNGRKFEFLVYSTHYESIVPKYNLASVGLSIDPEDWVEHDYIHFYKDDGSPVLDKATGEPKEFYYTRTEEKNYLEIEVECKKHYKAEVENAVTSQLLYFRDVKFTVFDSSGRAEHKQVSAPILYEDDHLIISDNNQFSKPHIVINRVSYGYIDFEELELEATIGNVGIKVGSNEVDILPNRERLKWSDFTRKTVVDRFRKAGDAAAQVLANSLKQTDFKEWFEAANAIIGWRKSSSLKGRMVGVAQVLNQMRLITKSHDSHPEFKPVPGFTYSHLLETMFPGISFRLIRRKQQSNKKASDEQKIERIPMDLVDSLFTYPVYEISGRVSPKLDLAILDQLHPGGFIIAKKPDSYKPLTSTEKPTPQDSPELPLADIEQDEVQEGINAEIKNDSEKEWLKEQRKHGSRYKNNWRVGIELLMPTLKKYEDIKVDHTKSINEKADEPTPEELRAMNQRIVLTTPRSDSRWGKAQPRIKDLDEFGIPLYYGFNTDEDKGLLRLAADITTKHTGAYEFSYQAPHIPDVQSFGTGSMDAPEVRARRKRMHAWLIKVGLVTELASTASLQDRIYPDEYLSLHSLHWASPDTPIMLAAISRDNTKYFAERFYYITEFFNTFENGVLSMNELLIKWNTGRLIKKKLQDFEFLNGMYTFNPQLHSTYVALKAYTDKYYRHVNSSSLTEAIIGHMDKVTTLQEFIREHSGDEEMVQAMAEELFNTNGTLITGAKAVELELLDQADTVIDWAKSIAPMMKMIPEMRQNTPRFSQDEEEAIRQYIHWRTT